MVDRYVYRYPERENSHRVLYYPANSYAVNNIAAVAISINMCTIAR